jgi:YbbR domain-containing protein
MKRLTNEQVLYMLLSLLIATVMWLYVANGQNPIVERDMSLDLHVRGLSPSEVVVRSPTQVKVRLQGPRSALAPLSPAFLDASVDLSGLRPGEHRVPVYVATPPEVRVVQRTPPEALVVLDTLARQRLPVELTLTGSPPEGVTLGPLRVSPTHVIISGAASQVEEVRHATVTIDTTNLRQQVVTSVPVRLVDASGQEVRGPTVTPPVVEAMVAAREGVIAKVVPVVPTITGVPAQGLGVTGVTAIPPTVALSGPGTVLGGVQSAATSPVDLAGATGDVTRRVALVLPGGVSSPTPRVTVVVRIGRALLSTIVRSVPVRVVGVPAGSVSRVVPDRVDVQVEGPENLVQHLNTAALVVEVDAAGQPPGSHQVNLRAILPPGVHLLAILPSRVTVVLGSS